MNAACSLSEQLAQLSFSCHRSGLTGPLCIWLKPHHQTSGGIKDTGAITERRRLHTETVQKSHFEEYKHLHDQIGQNVGKTLFMQKGVQITYSKCDKLLIFKTLPTNCARAARDDSADAEQQKKNLSGTLFQSK